MGTFQYCASMERTTFAILPYQNKNDRTAASFPMTHKS